MLLVEAELLLSRTEAIFWGDLALSRASSAMRRELGFEARLNVKTAILIFREHFQAKGRHLATTIEMAGVFSKFALINRLYCRKLLLK